MNSTKLRMMAAMMKKSLELPYDMQVEYLQSSGTQYIDTGIKSNHNLSVEIKFNMTSGSGSSVFGYYDDNNIGNLTISIGSDLPQRFGDKFCNATIPFDTDSIIITNKYGFSLNGNIISRSLPSNFSSYNTLYLMWINNALLQYRCSGKFYYCKIWDNDVLVRDLIPVRKGNVGYMYDKVSGQLFGNAGTGDFILGQDIVPVEYLESTGTQYIKTNINGNARIVGCAQSTTEKGSATTLISSSPVGAAGCWYGEALTTTKWGVGGGEGNYSNVLSTTKAIFDINFAETEITGTVNEESIDRTITANRGEWSIFASSTGQFPFVGKVFYINIYQNDTLVRDFIPVRVGQVGYMYDKVSNQLFGNAGTGNFIIGRDAVDYTQVEYLESTGTLYIDTGVIASSNFLIEIDGHFVTDTAYYKTLIGAYGPNSYTYTQFIGKAPNSNNAKYYIQVGGGSSYVYSNVSDLNRHVFISYIKSGKIYLNIDGVTSQADYSGEMSLKPLYLFGSNSNNVSFSEARIYYCKIYDNDILVRDFIPVRVGTIGYMYDKVSGRLFANAGTGSFILGDDIVPVEYLRSSASGELIDTGVSDIDKLEIKFRYAAYYQYYGMFGNYKDEDSNTWRLIHSTTSSSTNLLAYVGTKANGGNTNVPIATTGVDHTLVMSQTQIIYDGVTYTGTINTTQGTSNNKNIAIFARNLDDPVWSNIYMRCYYFKAWKNGNLVCDLIPVRIGQKGYMYNRVNGNMIAAYGGGNFILGNDITT